MCATKKGELTMQRKKRNPKTLIFVTVLSVAMLFLIVQCNGQKKLTAAEYQLPDSPLVIGWGPSGTPLDFSGIKGFVAEKEISMIILVAADGRAYISNREGREVLPCNYDLEKKTIFFPDNCLDLKGKTITSVGPTPSTTVVTTGSPNCITIKIGGFKIQIDPLTGKRCSN
jgi:hypothetical protein